MRDTVFCSVPDDVDRAAVVGSIQDMVATVQEYVPGYRLTAPPQFETLQNSPYEHRVAVFLEVEGAGDYLPPYSGNLDIMTAAAAKVGDELARRSLGSRRDGYAAGDLCAGDRLVAPRRISCRPPPVHCRPGSGRGRRPRRCRGARHRSEPW